MDNQHSEALVGHGANCVKWLATLIDSALINFAAKSPRSIGGQFPASGMKNSQSQPHPLIAHNILAKKTKQFNFLCCNGTCIRCHVFFFFQREPQGVTWPPHGGGEMLGKLSKIVILCYYVSIFYVNNYYKNVQNIKNCSWTPPPPGGGGVWCDTPAVKTTAHQMAWLERGQ